MAQLCLFLPPFSPDYSGAGAVLFDLRSLTVMHDAGGCTGNYTGHDEPRWYGSKATVFCSALRMIDAIMGNDEKLKKNIYEAMRDLHPELIAIVGSPVPTVIGMDIKGLAMEIESETGIPTIGVTTTGSDYYDIGEFKAAKALLEKFAKKAKTAGGSGCADRAVSYNILGATPLDYEREEDLERLIAFLKKDNFACNMKLGYGYNLDALRQAGNVSVNIAVSHAGYLIARYMEKEYGIPFLCGFPFGAGAPEAFAKELADVIKTGRSRQWGKADAKEGAKWRTHRILVIGEQVIANSVRYALDDPERVTVGCLFGQERDLAADGDLALSSEEAITRAVRDDAYDVIIADPIMKRLLPGQNCTKLFFPMPQYAVSGDLHAGDAVCLFGSSFNKYLKRRAL